MPVNIKKGDTVLILSGKDRGKKEKVLKVLTAEQKVLVEKVNIAKKHLRPTQKFQGGIVERVMPVPVSRVMLVCPQCHKPSRVKSKVIEGGQRVRSCGHCGEVIS